MIIGRKYLCFVEKQVTARISSILGVYSENAIHRRKNLIKLLFPS